MVIKLSCHSFEHLKVILGSFLTTQVMRFYSRLFLLRSSLFPRSSLFFYISGISLGMVSIFVFLLLVLKNFIPSVRIVSTQSRYFI